MGNGSRQTLAETVNVQKELKEDVKGVQSMMDSIKNEQYETKAEIMVPRDSGDPRNRIPRSVRGTRDPD